MSGKVLLGHGYGCIQPTGDAWDFDAFTPNIAAQLTVQAGPPGPAEADGEVTEAQFVAFQQGVQAQQDAVSAAIFGKQETLGTASGTSNSNSGSTYTSLLDQRFSAGTLEQISLTVAATGDIEILVMTGTVPNLTVVDRFPVTLAQTGSVVLTAGNDFPARQVPDCYLCPYTPAGSIAINNDGSRTTSCTRQTHPL